jgi:hypothetical protein
MRILVCGGRDYWNQTAVWGALQALKLKAGVDVIIEGGASGADALAASWALSERVPCIGIEADWGAHGKAAGPIRNQRMIDEGKPDLVIAFPGGKGTADLVRRARAASIEVREVEG